MTRFVSLAHAVCVGARGFTGVWTGYTADKANISDGVKYSLYSANIFRQLRRGARCACATLWRVQNPGMSSSILSRRNLQCCRLIGAFWKAERKAILTNFRIKGYMSSNACVWTQDGNLMSFCTVRYMATPITTPQDKAKQSVFFKKTLCEYIEKMKTQKSNTAHHT
jgi:hypothetical protein